MTDNLRENNEAVSVLSSISSYLGAGMGDENTTPDEFEKRIRWGIDHHVSAIITLAADMVERLSKKPGTTWGEVKSAIAALAAAPQPAPAPADERAAMIEVMDRAFSAWVETSFDSPQMEYLADALLAAGYRKAALAAAPQTAAEDQEARAIAEAAQITMTYRNWRGEVAQRTIRPVALWFGKTDWHPEPGWLLSAWDCDKGGRRDFALADCQFAALAHPSQAGDEPDMFWWADDGEYFYHDPQEALDQAGFDEVVQLDCAKRLPSMWAATVCLTLYEHGDPDKTEARLFATEDEAKRAWPESIAALAVMDTPKGGGDE